MYQIVPIFAEETESSFEVEVLSFLYYISDEGRLRKTTNAFGISGAKTHK